MGTGTFSSFSPLKGSGNCFTASILSCIAGSNRPDLIPGATELRSGSERLNQRIATAALSLLSESSVVKRKLLHTCRLSVEDLPNVVMPYLERLAAGAGDSQLWRHGEGGGASLGLGARHGLEDLVVVAAAHALQRNLLIFEVRPACAMIIHSEWFGIESELPPVTILYDRKLDHFSALVPQWSELRDLGTFILQDSLSHSIYLTPSELERRLSCYLTHKEGSQGVQ